MGFELLLDYKLDFTTTKTVPIRSLGKTSLWKGKYQLNPSKKTGEMARKGVNPEVTCMSISPAGTLSHFKWKIPN